MIGKNILWTAKQHGHGVQIMLNIYAAWLEGATPADIQAIRSAMESTGIKPAAEGASTQFLEGSSPQEPPEAATRAA